MKIRISRYIFLYVMLSVCSTYTFTNHFIRTIPVIVGFSLFKRAGVNPHNLSVGDVDALSRLYRHHNDHAQSVAHDACLLVRPHEIDVDTLARITYDLSREHVHHCQSKDQMLIGAMALHRLVDEH